MACGSGLRPKCLSKLEQGWFLVAYCCPLSKKDCHCSQTWKIGTVAKLPELFQNYKRNKTITMRCPSNNSRNTISAVTVTPPPSSASESVSRNATADAALLRPNVCFIWAPLSQTHMWLKYVAQHSNRNTPRSSEVLTCTSLERATLTPNEVRQGHVFENLTHILQGLCHSPLQMRRHWIRAAGCAKERLTARDYCVNTSPHFYDMWS